jgi:putative SOS response-associated peptidase YedK
MCGRYRLSRRKQLIEEYFASVSGDEEWGPRYNIAPTQPVPVIRQNPKEPVRELSLMRWGLIPSWAKDSSVAAQMINARSEKAGTKPAFRGALKFRRCLIPADGFYEWQRRGKSKQPYCFEVNDGELFAFAGLWDRWKDPGGQWLKSCSILTTTPNVVTSLTNLLKIEDTDDICPPWWPRLLFRLHVPLPFPWPGPGPVNYPPAIDNLMANLHIHTMSYLMRDENAAQQIRGVRRANGKCSPKPQ